jgi:tRNA threonylcarbamoyladenosine modification (KEOPS) complex Cgi121 subunit
MYIEFMMRRGEGTIRRRALELTGITDGLALILALLMREAQMSSRGSCSSCQPTVNSGESHRAIDDGSS